jgi:acyl dehydratase
MAIAEVKGIEGLKGLVGKTVGPGEWREVTQEMIDKFAEVSGDDQWIHVDVERAKRESPFGTTVAHGNLTLSMIDGLRRDLISSTGFALGVNYGWNKVRFPAPVPAGSRVRASGEVLSVEDVGGGWWQVVTKFSVEVEGSDKPACVGESVGRAFVPPEDGR